MSDGSISDGSQKISERIRAFVELEKHARNVRREMFDRWSVNDQAWVILQELYAAKLSGGQPQAGALALTTGMPVSTVLRYVDHLAQLDFVRLEPGLDHAADPEIWLTACAVKNLSAYYAIVSARLPASKS